MFTLQSSKIALIALFAGLPNLMFAQKGERYKTEVFSKIDSIKEVQYGEAVNVNGETEKLFLNIFQPVSDDLKKRPLVVTIHGGGFVNGDKAAGFQVSFCKSLTKKGYVTASINYRMGIGKPKSDATYFEAMYRAVQDAKAAVRFFRKNAEQYGIDTAKIAIMGGSAGSMTALHAAYLDQNEVPSNIDIKKLGTLEGTSGNAGFSSKVHAVINCWGAMVDYKWINKGDVPLYSVHGTADSTVPYDDSYNYHGFAYGSKILYERALAVGVPTGLRLVEKAGHNIGKDNYPLALADITAFLFVQLQNKEGEKIEPNGSTHKDVPQTLLLNGAVLAKNKQNTEGSKKEALKGFLAHADKILKAGKLYSVMNKKRAPASGDKHDYMSQAPYWWADTTKPNGLPYIRRDGERNPEYYLISDSDEMDKVIDDSEAMGLAYFYTRDERYAAHAAKLIKTWFLDKETRQNPNLNYSQGIPGINTGRGIGIIETRELVRLIDAAILLRGSKNWSNEDHVALKQWFSTFLTWLTDSPLGKDEAKEHNNHGTFYDAQVVAYAIFTDKLDLAKKQIDVTKSRMKTQIEPDGSQPHELARTVSFGYVNMNLYGFFTIARLAERVKTDLWQYKAGEGKNLQNCLDWLVPYLKKEKKWTHQQIKKMSYDDTLRLLRMATTVYANPDYDALAKTVDTVRYNAALEQLTF